MIYFLGTVRSAVNTVRIELSAKFCNFNDKSFFKINENAQNDASKTLGLAKERYITVRYETVWVRWKRMH